MRVPTDAREELQPKCEATGTTACTADIRGGRLYTFVVPLWVFNGEESEAQEAESEHSSKGRPENTESRPHTQTIADVTPNKHLK